MLWTKVTVKHGLFEYTDLSDSEFRAWIVLMLLAAELEKEPTREQMVKHVHHKTLSSLEDKFNKHSTSLQDIFKKVLEDAQDQAYKKERSKEKVKRFREHRDNVTGYEMVTLPGREEKRREEKRREDIKKEQPVAKAPRSSSIFKEPEVEEVKAYCTERMNKVDAQTFVDFYASKGWMVGPNKMKDWKACIRTWEKREGGKNNVSTVGTNSNRSFTARPSSINEAGDEDIRRMHEKWANLKKNANDKALRETEGNDVPDF